MTATLPDDPYHALGLAKDATAAAIKGAYRKLVLKHHPDKVQDESLKSAAADTFHKIQAAWELIGDEDKRFRYDAQARLAVLRKEAMDREKSNRDMRPPPSQPYRDEPRSYDMRESQRSAAYRTEEIRPPEPDYFDKSRREYELPERSRHTPTRDDRRGKPVRHDSKDAERARREERTRQSTRATARDRDAKYAQVEVESDSDSDRHRRSPRDRERERYQEQTRRQHEEASSRYYDERTQQKSADARDYIQRSTRRRPSPTRMASREEYVRDSDGRPVAFRRGSGRPKTSSRDDLDSRPRRREMERSSSELEEHPRRPPAFAQTKSAPHDIRLPYEKTRASSLQHTREELEELMPSVKRADSMPLQPPRGKPVRQSTLRQTQTSDDVDRRKPPTASRKEYADDYEQATPDGYIIENRRPPPRRTQSPDTYSRRRNSSPDNYRAGRTDSRESPMRRDSSAEPDRAGRGKDRPAYTRRDSSVEPDRSGRSNDRPAYTKRDSSAEPHIRQPRTQSPGPLPSNYRPSALRYSSQAAPVLPPLNTRTTSTSYMYSPTAGLETMSARPKLSRGDSGRKDSRLFGEIPLSRDREAYSAPVPDGVRYREVRPDLKMAAGYSTNGRRASEIKSPTSYGRGNSFSTSAMPA